MAEWITFLNLHYRTQRTEARILGEQILQKARKENNRQKIMVVLSHLAQAQMFDGDAIAAKNRYDESLALYDESADAEVAEQYGIEVKGQTLALSSNTYLHLGYPDTAYAMIKQSMAYSIHIGHNSSIAFAYLFMGLHGYFTSDNDLVINAIEEYYAIQKETRAAVWHSVFLDLLYACATGNIALAETRLQGMIDSGQDFATAYYVPYMAKVYREQGKINKAIEFMEEHLNRATTVKVVSAYPFLKYTLAQCYHAQDRQLTPRIERLLLAAKEDAVKQQAKYFELEIIVFYCQLTTPDSNPEGFSRLKTLIDWFDEINEGHNTLPYQLAKQQLNQYRSNNNDE
jgi:tetratricopeptide (TPR) repeat protein